MNVFILLFICIFITACKSTSTIDKKSRLTKNIYIDTTWKPSSKPIYVNGNVWIAGPATLRIEKGTVVHFEKGSYLTIEGRILVNGTKNEPVFFSSKKEKIKENDYWEHINIRPGKKKSIIKSAIFRNARAALFIENDNVEVMDCLFEHNTHGIFTKNASPSISKNLFRNNVKGIVSFVKMKGIISQNSFENNLSAGIHGIDNFFPAITQNIFINNPYGILIKYNENSNPEERPVIEFNDFKNNTKYNVYLQNFPEEIVLEAPSNFWGAQKPEKLKGKINAEPYLIMPQFIQSE